MPYFNGQLHFFTFTLHIQYQSLKLLNMKLDENILKTCQGFVMNCNCKVLIQNNFDFSRENQNLFEIFTLYLYRDK